MFNGSLYPFQQEAFDLILSRHKALVAFEMGLGKTPTSLAAVESLMDSGEIIEPGIIITLASLKYQWAASIEKFTNSKAIVIDGTRSQRMEQYAQARDWFETGIDYIILNYESLVTDYAQVRKLPRGFLIMDESTALKSFRSKRHKAVARLAKGVDVKIGLTGTPMTNGKPEEMFAQLQIIDPSVLGRFDIFDQAFIVRNKYGAVQRYRNLPTLHKRLGQVMISKLQTDPDVAPYLPETIYKDPVLVKLDLHARTLYRRIVYDLLADLAEADGVFGSSFDLNSHYGYGESVSGGLENTLRGRIGSKLTALRMLCDHPDLLRISASEWHTDSGKGSRYIASLQEKGYLDKLGSTPKLNALKKYVLDFLDQDPANKAVIFSVFVPTLTFIQQALGSVGSVTYSGSMNAKEKEAARLKFQTDPNVRLLISSDAGGFGVDLPQGNLVINYDLPWAPGTARQRNGRIQRASSTWSHVVVQNFLIDGSIEVRYWEMLQQKSRVESAVIEGRGINAAGGVDMNVRSLRAFLQKSTV